MADARSGDSPPNKLTLAPAEKAGECARKAIAFGVEALKNNQAAALKGEAEAMHQLRVASRRLRASIQMFENILYAAQVRIYRRDLKWIARQAGAVRDCDIKTKLVRERVQKIDPELAKSIDPIVQALELQRKAEHAALCESLNSKRYTALLAKLGAPSLRKASAQRKLGLVANEVLDPIVEDTLNRGKKLDKDFPARHFHKLRVRIKRLRYALEMLSTLGAKQHKKTLARLEALQDRLGEYNDTNVTAAWLMSYTDDHAMPARTVLAAGALIHSLGGRGKNLRRQSIKDWRRFERSNLLNDALEEIRRAGQLAPVEANLIAPPTAATAEAIETPAESQPQNDNGEQPREPVREPMINTGTNS